MAGEKKQKDAVTGVLNAGSRLVSACAALLAIVLILYSGYVLYDSMAIEMSAFSSNSDLLKYKPGVLAQPSGEEQPSLADINPDYRGWITVEGKPASPIDYPVMQGEDNLYYAFHDVYGHRGQLHCLQRGDGLCSGAGHVRPDRPSQGVL